MKTQNILTQFVLILVAVACFWAGAARGQEPIRMSVTLTNYSGPNVPVNFLGLSFEKSLILYSNTPFLSPSRGDVVTAFQNMTLRNIRVGGASADGTNGAHPSNLEISNLFEFAQASGVDVIYALQLLDFNLANNMTEGTYVETNSITAPYLEYIACGNEVFNYTNLSDWPAGQQDPALTNYNSYLLCWESNFDGILSAVPGALWAAPDDADWGSNFLKSVNDPAVIKLDTDHYYPNDGTTQLEQHITDMLSTNWLNLARTQYTTFVQPWVQAGYPYRWTEINDAPFVESASDGFASALWALDSMDWWASNGCAGVNFHNNLGNPSDTLDTGNPGNLGSFFIAPKGYAIKAFDFGSHGYSEPITTTNSANINVDCYATVAGQDEYVTAVNKQYSGDGGSGGDTAAIVINANGMNAGSVRAMFLVQSNANVEATNGVTLGGDTLTTNRQFVPGWSDSAPLVNGSCTVDVAIAEAVVIDIHAASAYSNPIQVNNNGTLELFSISTNGDVFSRSQLTTSNLVSQGSNPLNWGAGIDMGSLGSGVTAVGAAVVARNDDGTLELFVPGSDGNVYDNYQITPGGSWSGWSYIGGPSIGGGITNLQVGVNRDGSLNLFGIGGNGDIWNNTETAPHILGTNWTDWTDTAGVQPGIGVGQNLDGRLEVYGISSGTLYHKWQSSAGSTNWNTWASIDSGGATLLPGVEIGRNVTGDIYVFALDASSSNVDYISQTGPGQTWGTWNTSALGTLPTGLTVQSGFAVGEDSSGEFEVLAMLTDGNVYHNVQSSSSWSGWTGSSLGSPGSDPRLVTANTEDGRLQIFANVYTNSDIMSTWQTTPGGSWSSWTDFGGYCWHGWDNPGTGTGFTNGFGACSWGPNRIDIFGVQSSNGKVYHNWWNGSAWQSSWEARTNTVTPVGGAAASANINVPNREDVFYIGTDGNLYCESWTNAWSPWQNLSKPSGETLVGSPSATSWATNREDVFVRDANGNIWHIYNSTGGSWSSWEEHGQNAAGAVTNDPTSSAWGANRLDIYTLGNGNGELYHQYWAGAGWQPSISTWAQDLPETTAYSVGASTWGIGRIDLYANTGSAIAHNWYDSNAWNAGWNPNWNQMVTPPASPASSPSAASWQPGRIDMFVLGSNGDCYHIWYW